jgi:hypothetical protein
MGENMSLSDIAAVTGNNDCNGVGGGAWWIIVLFLFAFMGNGLWGNRSGMADALTQADLQRAIDLNSIQEGQRDIEARVQEVGAENATTVKDAAYNNLSEIRDVQAAMAAGFANQQTCCCETQRAIDGVNYNGATNTAAINANTTAQVQKVLDAISQNRMAEMQSQINQLQMQNAMCGVVRYPSATTYTAGGNPYFGGGMCAATF